MDFGDRSVSYPRIGQLIVDELIQFLTEASGNSFAAAGIQISG
jgi:hypothetical protein